MRTAGVTGEMAPAEVRIPAMTNSLPTVPQKVRLERAPLVAPASAVVMGVASGLNLPLHWTLYGLLMLAGLAAAVWGLRQPHLRHLAAAGVLAAIFGLSGLYANWRWNSLPPDHVVTYTQNRSSMSTLRGQIVTSPQLLSDGPEMNMPYKRADRTMFLFACRSILTDGGWVPSQGLVRVTVEEPARLLAAGQQVELTCRLGRQMATRNPGQFDSARSARLKGVLTWASVPSADGVEMLQTAPQDSIGRFWWRLRAASREYLVSLDDDSGHLLNALIIGERHPALRTLNQSMVKAGVAHYLSISGTHLAIFLGFIYLLCRLVTLSPARSALAVLVVLGGYLLLAELSSPLMRSGVMAASLCIGTLAGRRYSALNSLAAAAILLLAINPMSLMSAGFQFSFGIVLGILLLSRPLKRAIFGRMLRRQGLMVFREDQALGRWLHFKALNYLIAAVTVSTSAYIVSAPLAACHFGIFSPYAGLLSLLLAPLVSLVLVSGYLSMSLLLPLPNLSHALGSASATLADLLQKSVDWMQFLPGLYMELRPVSLWWAFAVFAAIAAYMLRNRFRRATWTAAALTVICIAYIIYSQLPARAPQQAQLHILAVGAGQCAILQSPSGKTYLFDAGTRSPFDPYQMTLKPFIRQRRLPWPTAIFLSHPNSDHYNAAVSLLKEKPVKHVYLSPYFITQPKPEQTLADAVETFRTRSQKMTELQAGQTVQLDQHLRVEVLWPPTGQVMSDNDASLTLKLSSGGQAVLLTGDVEAAAQVALSEMDIACDVLVLPHHGSYEPTLEKFVKQCNPTFIIVSAAKDPAPPRPQSDAAALNAKLRREYRYFGTWSDGAILVQFGKGKLDVGPQR